MAAKLHPDDDIGITTQFVARPRRKSAVIKLDHELVVQHLREVAAHFETALIEEMEARKNEIKEAMENRAFDRGRSFLSRAIPFRINVDEAIEKMSPAAIQEKADLIRKGNKGLHPNQIRSLVSLMIESSLELTKPGVVISPMQSGKTGLALAVALFLAPLMYQLAGVKFYPLFLSTHLDTHASQTLVEFAAVMELYGDLIIEVTDEEETFRKSRISPSEYYTLIGVLRDHYADHVSGIAKNVEDSIYFDEPTPRAYRNVIMRNKLTEQSDDIQIVYNRRAGAMTANLRKRMSTLVDSGFSLLLLVDEPQQGASGDLIPTGLKDKHGQDKFRGVVIKQIVNDILQELLLDDGKHMAILFSATPFDTANMEGMWRVRAKLSSNYVGYNMWHGEPIDDSVWVRTPTLYSFDEIAGDAKAPSISQLREKLGITRSKDEVNYTSARRTFMRLIEHLRDRRPHIAKEIKKQRPEHAALLREMLDGPVGICVRFVNDNRTTNQIIDNLKLEKYFQVFRYFGGTLIDDDSKLSLTAEQVLDRFWDREDPRPPLFVVTNQARMGDNFPRVIEIFMDFSNSASDLNSLLQGVNGRACGEKKFFSQVVLTQKPCDALRDYVNTMGMPIMNGSRHSILGDGVVRRGRGVKIARVGLIGEQADDPVIAKFIKRINKHIVYPRFSDEEGMRRKVGKLPSKPEPYYDLASIIRKTTDDRGRNIIEYLNDPEVQERLFPNFKGMEIINPLNTRDRIEHKGTQIGYVYADDGTMKLSFRDRPTTAIDEGHYGITNRDDRSRPSDKSAQTDRAMTKSGLEIQVNVLKRKTRHVNSKEVLGSDREGYPEAYMVTFPLRKEVRPSPKIEGKPVTIASQNNWVASMAHPREQDMWVKHEAAKEMRARARKRKTA